MAFYPIDSCVKLEDGTLHMVHRAIDSADLIGDIEYLITDGVLSKARSYRTVARLFGVEESALELHPSGLITEESLRRLAPGTL
jgi:hypothetical protein